MFKSYTKIIWYFPRNLRMLFKAKVLVIIVDLTNRFKRFFPDIKEFFAAKLVITDILSVWQITLIVFSKKSKKALQSKIICTAKLIHRLRWFFFRNCREFFYSIFFRNYKKSYKNPTNFFNDFSKKSEEACFFTS